MPLATMWPLSVAWYGDRLRPGFRPASAEHLQGLLTGAGLTDPFWSLS